MAIDTNVGICLSFDGFNEKSLSPDQNATQFRWHLKLIRDPH